MHFTYIYYSVIHLYSIHSKTNTKNSSNRKESKKWTNIFIDSWFSHTILHIFTVLLLLNYIINMKNLTSPLWSIPLFCLKFYSIESNQIHSVSDAQLTHFPFQLTFDSVWHREHLFPVAFIHLSHVYSSLLDVQLLS